MVSRGRLQEVIDIYRDAWIQKDANLITTIFTSEGTYAERAFEEPHQGHTGIKKYWEEKVIGEQDNIDFQLLHSYIDGDVAIVEWEASFDNKPKNVRTTIREVAILEFEDELIRSLREYWHSRQD